LLIVTSTGQRKPSNEARELFENLKRDYSRLEDTIAALNQTDASDQILSEKRYAENQEAANAVRDQWPRMKHALVGLRSTETQFMFHELDQLNVSSTELQAVKAAIAIIENIFGAAPTIDPNEASQSEATAVEPSVPGPESQSADLGAADDQVKRRRRGRPTDIPETRKAAALQIKEQGGKPKEVARILYDVRNPTSRQRNNIYAILKHYERTNRAV
jgi:hypothetical protein